MEHKYVGFLRTRILEFMAKYIGIDDLGYVVANVISEVRVKEVEYEFTNPKMKSAYVISIKLSKENSK